MSKNLEVGEGVNDAYIWEMQKPQDSEDPMHSRDRTRRGSLGRKPRRRKGEKGGQKGRGDTLKGL